MYKYFSYILQYGTQTSSFIKSMLSKFWFMFIYANVTGRRVGSNLLYYVYNYNIFIIFF